MRIGESSGNYFGKIDPNNNQRGWKGMEVQYCIRLFFKEGGWKVKKEVVLSCICSHITLSIPHPFNTLFPPIFVKLIASPPTAVSHPSIPSQLNGTQPEACITVPETTLHAPPPILSSPSTTNQPHHITSQPSRQHPRLDFKGIKLCLLALTWHTAHPPIPSTKNTTPQPIVHVSPQG